MGGFCPGDFVQGDFVRGDFVLGGILSRGILSGGFCPGGFVRGDFVLEPRNLVCHLRLKTCVGKVSPDFTMQELFKAISELKNEKCADLDGLIREIFKNDGNNFRQSILKMVNAIKNAKDCPSE